MQHVDDKYLYDPNVGKTGVNLSLVEGLEHPEAGMASPGPGTLRMMDPKVRQAA